MQGLGLHRDGRWRLPPDGEAAHAMIRERFAAAANLLHTPDRRQFMRLMAASLALAGLTGCDDDDPHDEIIPPVTQTTGESPTSVLTYASSTLLDGFANGVMVTTREGRPLKIEGNPKHPWSRGGTDVFGQASVLSLYDPFRSQSVQFQTRDSDLSAFRAAMLSPLAQLRASGGAGFALLLGPVTSPSLIAQIAAMQSAWPKMRVFTHVPCSREVAYQATARAFGRPLETHWDFRGARAIVALDGDLLDAGPQQVGAARSWVEARRASVASGGLLEMFAASSVPGLTSAKADHGVTADPDVVEALALGLLARMQGGSGPDLPEAAATWRDAAFHALAAAKGASVVQTGLHAGVAVQEAAQRLNAMLGNTGKTVLHTDPLQIRGESIAVLADAMRHGEVGTLLMLGVNPVYDAAGELDFAGALGRVALKIHANLYVDETAVYADWHLPMTHPLEAWGDARALDGSAGIVQPTIAPLYGGRSAAEVLSLLSDTEPRGGLDLLRAHWVDASAGDASEQRWRQALLTGTFEAADAPLQTVRASSGSVTIQSRTAGLQLCFRPDQTVWDGTWSDNGWLQELPKPLSKVVWENTVQVSPGLAKRAGLAQGDVVTVSVGDRSLSGPVWVQQGQSDGVVALSLGYGKRAVGQLSAGLGFDAFALRSASDPWQAGGATLHRTAESRVVASTADHARMNGVDVVRVQRVGAAPVGDGDGELPTLYEGHRSDGRAWGMVIDLDSCIGCNACVTACQSENNIAIVGRDEVLNGREMHWLRVDAYPVQDRGHGQAATDLAPLATSFMPVPCMHCEQAPCEVGCPVEATLHDHEGLNLMVYNRCIGTRACSGYCPYKVRRFNYADYSAGAAPSIVEQRNPDVTVRARGVMEKCTYCVQRIAEARAVSDRTNTPIVDGVVQTACQSACPTQAIVFGDLALPDSQVSRSRRDPRRYALLGELNTRPRTTYLAALAPQSQGEG